MSERERTSPNTQGGEAAPDAPGAAPDAPGAAPDAPGGELSDQNREESSHPPAASGTGRAQRQDKEEGGAQRRGQEAEDGGRAGGAGEGSQATGHPENAG